MKNQLLALGMTLLGLATSAGTAAAAVPAITDVQLINAENYAPLQDINDGDNLVLADMPDLVNVKATSADPDSTGSVKFLLDGPTQVSRIENNAVYTLESDLVSFNVRDNELPVGSYILWVTPYAGSNATGEAGQTLTTTFTVSATENVEKPVVQVPAITGIQVVSGVDFSPIETLADGDHLVLAELPDQINMQALSADAGKTGSVRFVLEGPQSLSRMENNAIYTLADAYENFDLNAGDLPDGDYTLRVTPFSGANTTGDAGETLVTRFSVSATAPVEKPESQVPAITGVQVVSGVDFSAVTTLSDGATLVLSEVPELINIEALSADASKTGSVDFVLTGPTSIARMENNAIYTLADAYENLDLSTGDLPEGRYSLSITPYAGKNKTGEKGNTFTMTFAVRATDVQPEPEPEPEPGEVVSNVPAITGLRLLNASTGDLTAAASIANGAVIDLSTLPSVINFEALSADADETGSVAFELAGPRALSRLENNAIYTLADAYENLDLPAGDLPSGSYTLSITPYAGADASGEKGQTFVTSFTLVGVAQAPAPDAPVANNDSYTGSANKTLTIGRDAGVMSNDSGETLGTAQVQVASRPSHGTLVLSSNGAFTYEPDYNFSGVDNFSYSLWDAYGSEVTASVTLTINEAASSDKGFTPIVASDDTRTVYVSSSEGLDSNAGLSIGAPVKTLNKAFRLVRSGYPDHVLLKRGDVWVDENLNGIKSGRSKAEPAVVAFYGETGARPKLKTSGYSWSSSGTNYVNIMGLEIVAYKLNPADRAYDGRTSANIRLIGEFKNILFEDMKFRFVEFIVQGYDNKRPRDFHIRRSMILDKYSPGSSYSKDSRPSGIYTDHGEGLTIEESLWDHNGWNAEVVGAGANMYNHNMYISERDNAGNKVVIRDNIVTRGSSHGIHGRPGGLYENNFFARNAISLQMGYHGGSALSADTFAYARNNVITEGLYMGRGIDACANRALCTGAIWGLWVENLGQADVRVEGNIVSNRMEHNSSANIYAEGLKKDGAASYSNNIVYQWNDQQQGTGRGYPDPERTLADYNASLGGERSFEAFIQKVRNRGLQQWDERYSADAINDYIRAGFGR